MNSMNIGRHGRALLWLVVGAVLGGAVTHNLHAQQGGIQRTMLFRTDVPQASAPMEVILGTAEIPAGSHAGKHLHSGMEVGYVLSGTAVMEVAGEAPLTLKAGDTYFIAPGKVHDAKATGDTAAKVLAFYLVEKGRPLATAAP